MIDIFAGWLLAIIAVEVSDRFHDWREMRSLDRAPVEVARHPEAVSA